MSTTSGLSMLAGNHQQGRGCNFLHDLFAMLALLVFDEVIQILLKLFTIRGIFKLFGHDARSFRFVFY